MVLQKMFLAIGLCMLVQMSRSHQVGCSSPGCAFISSQSSQFVTKKRKIPMVSSAKRRGIRDGALPFEKSKSDVSRVGTHFMSSETCNKENDNALAPSKEEAKGDSVAPMFEEEKSSWFQNVARLFQNDDSVMKPPPPQIEDTNLLFYDVFLILNLSLSISFWVVHRMSFDYIGSAIGEGSLLCILWIAAGLYNGAFLNSAVDGHYGSSDERGGPKAAGLLGLQTYIGAVNLRICFALVMAVLEHRPVGIEAGEQMIPLEIVFGLVLMSMWRALHSSYVPRI